MTNKLSKHILALIILGMMILLFLSKPDIQVWNFINRIGLDIIGLNIMVFYIFLKKIRLIIKEISLVRQEFRVLTPNFTKLIMNVPIIFAFSLYI